MERKIVVYPQKRQIEWREGHRERADLGWECTSRRASRSLAGCSSSYYVRSWSWLLVDATVRGIRRI